MNELVFTVAPNKHIVTQGDTLEELRAMIMDAIDCHFFDEPANKPQTAHVIRGVSPRTANNRRGRRAVL
ncbi:MAG: hypothetical protein LH606_18110 [Cytophagaceae bacterium]|nr:hypothetical protein [Cytophagaceae bacterium]